MLKFYTEVYINMKSTAQIRFTKGLLFTCMIATISLLLAKLPILSTFGALSIAIILAMIYRQIFGYPEEARSGITFTSKRLLKFAIILYGLKLNMNDVLGKGWKLLLIDIGVAIFAISVTIMFNQLIKGDTGITLLLGIGTGICGAAAIGATAPILKSKEKDTAISVGIIAIVGTGFALIYTAIETIFKLPASTYGAWTGVSLHEIAHVVLTAGVGGSEAMKLALLGKLGRVFLLIPLSIILMMMINYKNASNTSKQRIDVPYFLIGFIIIACANTFIHIPHMVMYVLNIITTICILMAMVALGLNVAIKDVLSRAFKPLIVIIFTPICLSLIHI